MDQRVAALAGGQRGVVTAAQLAAAGLTREMIRHRLATGRLHRRHRGVYVVGHRAEAEFAAETAALLACGPGGVLSHRSAAAVWRLLPAPAVPEVTVPRSRRARHGGLVAHRTATLRRDEVRVREGLPVTAPLRTLHDLAAVATPAELARAVNEAHALRLVPPGPLRITPNRPGVERLRAASGTNAKGHTRSAAEAILRRLLHQAGLPPPETNAVVAGVRVDAVWREQRLVVELDGAATHAHQLARDRRNEAALRAAGFDVLRLGWEQLTRQPELVVALVAAALARQRDAA